MGNILRKVSQIFQSKNSDSPHSHGQQDIPNNNNPSRDSIPLPTSPLKDIPRNILAFRTITKLLSEIRQEREFQVSYSEAKLLPRDCLELKLSNAFSTIAVIEHDVAVVTKCTRKMLKVIACTQISINEDPLITPLVDDEALKVQVDQYW
jgi:hypothetical protein